MPVQYKYSTRALSASRSALFSSHRRSSKSVPGKPFRPSGAPISTSIGADDSGIILPSAAPFGGCEGLGFTEQRHGGDALGLIHKTRARSVAPPRTLATHHTHLTSPDSRTYVSTQVSCVGLGPILCRSTVDPFHP